MVTVNNVCKRFESKSVMSDSYVEKYTRARKRAAKTPKKCLFEAPAPQETEEFISQKQAQEEDESEAVLQKYDVEQAPADLLEQSTDNKEASAVALTSSVPTPTTSEGLVFQPRIVSAHSPAPYENVFTPIEKIQSSSSTSLPRSSLSSPSISQKADTTSSDYWQTSKRRRVSSKKRLTESKTPDLDDAVAEKRAKE